MKSQTSGKILLIALAALTTFLTVASRSLAVETVYPAERAGSSFRRQVLSRIAGFFRGAEAQAENLRLRREVAALALLREETEQLERENARLRTALDYTERTRRSWLPAEVLSDGGAAGVRQILRVGKGSLAGVREGAVVVAPEGLVGRVTVVTPHTAEVTLISDPALKVACELEVSGGQPPVRGVLAGGSAERLQLRYLADAGEMPPRSRVFTSGLGGVFPRGIGVGTLLDVRRDAKGRVCEGEVQPQVDLSALEDVFIRREE